ncbi:hypothetical protein J3E69DRAFT_321816 [Trichoderma sp. SZMC 28015]
MAPKIKISSNANAQRPPKKKSILFHSFCHPSVSTNIPCMSSLSKAVPLVSCTPASPPNNCIIPCLTSDAATPCSLR